MRHSLLQEASASAGAPGSPAYTVLLEQLTASCEELDVRKEEVLILRSQLVSQKEAVQHKVAAPGVSPPVGEQLRAWAAAGRRQTLCPPPAASGRVSVAKVHVTKGGGWLVSS